MPTIYFTRHGETDWNAAVRLQGQRDIPLNDTGRGQAKRNGRVLAEMIETPDALDFVASPLIRACETMEIIRGELGLPREGYRLEPGLMEINYGAWEGLTWKELRAKDPDAYAARKADPWHMVAPGDGGESYALLHQRAERWLATVERDTLVVAHGGIKRCLEGIVKKLDPLTILGLDVPQDEVMVIRDGAVSFL